MDTRNAPPPGNAIVLFDGSGISNWTSRDGDPAQWRVEGNILHVTPGAGDIMTTQRMTDFVMHLEFRCPDMPQATGQAKGNSGVFLQGRYEVQVLDSYGWDKPGLGDCGAIYNQFAPLSNGCRPAMEWQTYDVVFRAPRAGDSGPTLSLAHNDIIIHNNVQLPGVTGAAIDEDILTPGPLLLQDHRDLVCYRNIWIVELAAAGSSNYEPA
jgi:hypothetical protein